MPLHLLDHPLAAHCLAVLRDRRTGPDAFRRYCERLTLLLAVEATRGLGTALAALAAAGAADLRLLTVVAAPEGLALIAQQHPQVAIFAAAKDRCLDARKFIVPGLGDFGDRLYGTLDP